MQFRLTSVILCGSLILGPIYSSAQSQATGKKPATAGSAKSGAAIPGTMARAPNGVSDSNKALEVKGQTRNLSMMLTLKNRGDNIDFVKPRQNYQSEIKNTGF